MRRLILVILLGIVILNCSLAVKQINNDNDTGLFKYGNHLLFKYRSNIELKRDNESFKPITFNIELPKGVKYWEVINSSNFGFYYKSNQVIFVSTDVFDKRESNDTSYIPNKDEVETLIRHDFETSNHRKWSINKIHLKRGKKQFVVKKGRTLILLLNIKEGDLEEVIYLVNKYTEEKK